MGLECVLTFGGVSSRDLGITVEAFPGSVLPERDIQVEIIPGRDGALLYDYGTYKNYNQKYTIHWKYENKDGEIAKWLGKTGYNRLEDSFHPDHYRMAYCALTANVDNRKQVLKRAQITFSCKPQWFLKSGEEEINITEDGQTINNPGMDSLPLITVKGTGACTITLGGITTEITEVPEAGIVLDSELQDAYSVDGLTNLNALVIISDKGFPKIKNGINEIHYTGDISSISIIPRTWELL